METVSRHILRHAQQLAREVSSRAVLVYADALREGCEQLRAMDFATVLVTARPGTARRRARRRMPGSACPTSP